MADFYIPTTPLTDAEGAARDREVRLTEQLEAARMRGSLKKRPMRYKDKIAELERLASTPLEYVEEFGDIPDHIVRLATMPDGPDEKQNFKCRYAREVVAVWKEVLPTLPTSLALQADRIAFEQLCRLIVDMRNSGLRAADNGLFLNLLARFAMTPYDRLTMLKHRKFAPKPKSSGGGAAIPKAGEFDDI